MSNLERKWSKAREAYQCGRLGDAVRMYRQLVRQQPGNVGLALELATVQAAAGAVADARAGLDRLRKLAVRDAGLAVQVASVYFRMGDHVAARGLLEELWEKGREPAVGTGLLEVLERMGDMEEAGRLADALAAREPRAGLMQGVLALRGGDAERADNLLGNLLADMPSRVEPRTVYRAGLTRASALERLGRYAEAWQVMCRAKEVMLPVRKRLEEAERLLEKEQQGHRERISRFTPPEGEPAETAPLLVAGHPRSGTSVYAVHCAAERGLGVADEVGAFAGVAVELGLDGREPASWGGKLAEKVRAGYRERMLASMPGLMGEASWVDKNPGLEWRLDLWLHAYPGAEVVLVRREPLDLLVSCLFTYLPMNAWSAKYLDAEGAAESIAASMEVQDRLLERGAEGVRVLNYEDFVRARREQQPALNELILVNHSPNYAIATGKVLDSRVGRVEHYREFLPASVLQRWSG